MDDKRLIIFLERSIPSYINKVRKRELSIAQATRNFGNQLKRIQNRQQALELQNAFNNQLRQSQQKPDSDQSQSRDIENDPGEFDVVIDGPSSIRPNQSVSFTAKTAGSNIEEDYIWETEGGVDGLDLGSPGSSSKNYVVKASADCQSGMLYLTATGTESGSSGALFIQVIGADKQPNGKENKADDPDGNAAKPTPSPETEDESANDGSDADDQSEQEKSKQNSLQKWFSEEGKKLGSDFFKKLVSKEFWAGIWAALAPVLPYIIVIVLIIVASIAIWAAFSRQTTSGAAGSTVHQEVNLANDTNLVERTLLATGDEGTRTAIVNKTFPQIRTELVALKESADPATKAKIEETVTKIDQYMSNNNPDLGKEIVSSIKEILGALDLQAPVMQVKTRSPLDKVTDYNFYQHYSTPLNKQMPKDGGHATYMYYGEGKSDAVDLYAAAGSAVYPAFPGKITDLSDDGTGHKKVIVENGDYQILYANIEPINGLASGQTVNISTSIGKIVDIDGQTQVHVELAYQGKPIVTTELDAIDFKQSQNPWGQYLWEHMKKVLGLK